MGLGKDILGELGEGKKAVEKGLSKGEIAARRYPWSECISDGQKKGLTDEEARKRCLYIACCVSNLPNKVKSGGGCKDVACGKPPKGATNP